MASENKKEGFYFKQQKNIVEKLGVLVREECS